MIRAASILRPPAGCPAKKAHIEGVYKFLIGDIPFRVI
ncbi:hypothetical protein DCCM_4837 [Desulfocucumis palustris]|uniref:Uncharacterized protein n=1 Tax=Desulfocucumis palustris TaxID=1898651 RepID=A0A2L2XHJ1_9FIRM|nr:hypothetical protein DCCM_4837 [Desulfocucumis palustris]